jgi:uncharacterized protein
MMLPDPNLSTNQINNVPVKGNVLERENDAAHRLLSLRFGDQRFRADRQEGFWGARLQV